MKKGFTLIELLSVIVILTIILAITIPNISNAILVSKVSSFKIELKTLAAIIDTKRLKEPSYDITTLSAENLEDEVDFDASNYAYLTVTLVDNKAYLIIHGTRSWNDLKACGNKTNADAGRESDDSICN